MPFPMGGWQRRTHFFRFDLDTFYEFALYYTFLVSFSFFFFDDMSCWRTFFRLPLCISHRLIRSIPSYAVFLDHATQPWFSFFLAYFYACFVFVDDPPPLIPLYDNHQ